MDLAQFKAVQREVWAEGDYRPVGRLLEPAARMLVDAAQVSAGQRVLDVATGSGSVAVHAARAGADVVGVDITNAWFDEASRRAADAGVDVELLIGDAEDLPVDAASFDVVLSGFGAIFAPRHDIVAAELARATRPGGTIALTSWTPSGANDAVFSVLLSALPPPPEFVMPSIRWGDPDHVRDLFEPHGVTLRCERSAFPVGFGSPAAFESFVFDNSGGFIRARQTLEGLGRWEETHAAMRDAIEATNEADDGTYRVSWDFLLTLGTKGS